MEKRNFFCDDKGGSVAEEQRSRKKESTRCPSRIGNYQLAVTVSLDSFIRSSLPFVNEMEQPIRH
jgi:hypothetical protein